MRDIKFRVWDTQRSGWSKLTEAVSIEGHPVYIDADDRLHKAAGVELMQYTGLKDKNGKEIFEGDLLRWRSLPGYPDPVDDEYGGAVIYNNGRFQCPCKDDPAYSIYPEDFDECEVIGNIYENSELLEQAK